MSISRKTVEARSLSMQDVLDQVQGVRSTGVNQYSAQCPAHNDNSNSLSIGTSDSGRLLLNCHAGCSFPDVLESLSQPTSQPQSLATLTYTRPSDSALPTIPEAQVDQMHSNLLENSDMIFWLKETRHLSSGVIFGRLGLHNGDLAIPIRNEDGEVTNVRLRHNDDETGRGSYRSIEAGRGKGVLYPIDVLKHDTLILCEGELDALALESIGYPAITNTNGAVTFTAEMASKFKGKSVRILMDNDEAGDKGARLRATLLKQAGARLVYLCSWPPDRPDKHDITAELEEYGPDSIREIFIAATAFIGATTPTLTIDTTEIDDESDSIEATSPNLTIYEAVTTDPDGDSFADLALPDIDPDTLPESLTYLKTIASSHNCAMVQPYMPAMVMLGAALARKAVIKVGQGDWHISTNLYGMAVGKPGSGKSAPQAAVRKAFTKIESEWFRAHHASVETYLSQMKAFNAREKVALKGIAEEPEGYEALQKERPLAPMPVRRLFASSFSEQKLYDLVADSPSLTVYRDELDAVLSMASKQGNETLTTFLLESHAGIDNPFSHAIKSGEETRLERSAVSIFGSTQPEVIKPLLRSAGSDGLLERFNLQHTVESKPRYFNNTTSADTGKQAWEAAVRRFVDLDLSTIGADSFNDYDGLAVINLTPEAVRRFEEWQHENEDYRIAKDDGLSGWYAKAPKTLLTIACVHQLLDGIPAPIQASYIDAAIAIWNVFKAHTEEIYEEAYTQKAEHKGPARKLLDAVADGRIVLPSNVNDMRKKGLGNSKIRAAADELIKAGVWKAVSVSGKKGVYYDLA
jgi:hypothetical protein